MLGPSRDRFHAETESVLEGGKKSKVASAKHKIQFKSTLEGD